MEREWRVISWAHNYEVSNYGEVRNFNTKRELKTFKTRSRSSRTVMIYDDKGKKVCSTIARLVAEAFIPNPDNLPLVTHINGNSNSVDNIMWSEWYGVREHTGGNARSIPILCVETGKIYKSGNECIREAHICYASLKQCLDDPNHSHNGYHFVRVS